MMYRLVTHDGTVLEARECAFDQLPAGEPNELGIGTILVTQVEQMIDVAIPFIIGWARYGEDVVLVAPTEFKPYYLYMEIAGKKEVFPWPKLEYHKAEEILILMDCGFVLRKADDIPGAATFTFGWAKASHDYGFWRQFVNGVHCFADMLQNYLRIPAKVRPDMREFMAELPTFPLELSSGEALGFYIGCMAPFAMLQSFDIDRDYRMMRKVVIERTLSGIAFPDWFDPKQADDEASLWRRTDALYMRNADAGIAWVIKLCREAENWLPRLRELAFAGLSLCSAFEDLLMEKARWTAMSAYSSKQCSLCANERMRDSVLCQYHWDAVVPNESRSTRIVAARNIVLIFHQLAILGFQVAITRVYDEAEGAALALHCSYPDGCRVTIETPIRVTGATQIEEWLERLVKHQMTHQLEPSKA